MSIVVEKPKSLNFSIGRNKRAGEKVNGKKKGQRKGGGGGHSSGCK